MINTAVILPCCFRLSLLFARFVVECGATITGHCRRRLRHISPDQGPRLMCECKLKRFPWGRAVLITKFEEDSSYNCVLRTVCPNAPIVSGTHSCGSPSNSSGITSAGFDVVHFCILTSGYIKRCINCKHLA